MDPNCYAGDGAVLQSFVLPSGCCMEQEIYFKTEDGLEHGCEKTACVEISAGGSSLHVDAGAFVSSRSYMNLFDMDFWKLHTYVKKIRVCWEIQGKGEISLFSCLDGRDRKLWSLEYDGNKMVYEAEVPDSRGYLFFTLKAKTATELVRFQYICREPAVNEVGLAVVICTYKREEQLKRNLSLLQKSLFFKEAAGNAFSGKLDITVVDNARTFWTDWEETGGRFFLIPNRNTGGSGGFSRGMQVLRSREKKPTHVVLMDDDADFCMESFYRLFALLSYMKPEYAADVIAGRMFRLDMPYVQYTASEVWNRGNLEHIGGNVDMRKTEALGNMNEGKGGEYAGWWFAVYPYSFVEGNEPLPFFLHCDDVEYGLRHGGTPIILNGVQVWHETYEYRQQAYILYYDTRNSLFVNEIMEIETDWKKEWEKIYKKITDWHKKRDFLLENMYIRGVMDYTRGLRWLKKVDGEHFHKKLTGKRETSGLRYENAVMWRILKIILLSR